MAAGVDVVGDLAERGERWHRRYGGGLAGEFVAAGSKLVRSVLELGLPDAALRSIPAMTRSMIGSDTSG